MRFTRKTLLPIAIVLALITASRATSAQQLTDGQQTLKVQIRAGGVVGTVGGETVDRWPASRTLFFAPGTRVEYSLRPAAGYRDFKVRVFGPGGSNETSVTSGTIVMDGQRTLSAISERGPAVVAENREIHGLLMQIGRGGAVTPLIPRYLDAKACLESWYGAERAGDLLEDAQVAAREAIPNAGVWERFQSMLERNLVARTTAGTPPPACTKARPA